MPYRRFRRHPQRGTYTHEFGPLDTDVDENLYVEVDITYTITPGEDASYDDPGYGPEVEIDVPAGITLTGQEEADICVRIQENHTWFEDDE